MLRIDQIRHIKDFGYVFEQFGVLRLSKLPSFRNTNVNGIKRQYTSYSRCRRRITSTVRSSRAFDKTWRPGKIEEISEEMTPWQHNHPRKQRKHWNHALPPHKTPTVH
jgi:hypothetical protein